MNLNYRNIIVILYSPETQKYIQIKDLLILMMDLRKGLIGHAL